MTTTLRIVGMSCNGCVKHVTEALRGVSGVTAVAVDLAAGRATVDHEAAVTSLVTAVESAGYEATVTP